MTQVITTTAWLQDRYQVVREALHEIPKITWLSAHQGVLQLEAAQADVQFEQGDWLAIRLPWDQIPAPLEALREHGQWHGNARHALAAGRRVLLAETQLDGVAHLPQTIDEIAAAMSRNLPEEANKPVDKGPIDLSDAVAGLPYAADDVVRLDKGFEFRIRVHGELTPVRVISEADSVRIERVVLDEMPQGPAAEAIALETLRINAALRSARLSIVGRQLVAGTRLHRGQLTSSWLQKGAEAVAVAAHYAQTPITMLARNPALVECFAALWLSDHNASA